MDLNHEHLTRVLGLARDKQFVSKGEIVYLSVGTMSSTSFSSGFDRSTNWGEGVFRRSISGGVLALLDDADPSSWISRSSRTLNMGLRDNFSFCALEASRRWAEKSKGPYRWSSDISIFPSNFIIFFFCHGLRFLQFARSMEQHTLKNVNNCWNTNIYSYLETSGGQSSNPHLNVVHFLTPEVD